MVNQTDKTRSYRRKTDGEWCHAKFDMGLLTGSCDGESVGKGDGGATFDRVVKEGLYEEVTLERSPKE